MRNQLDMKPLAFQQSRKQLMEDADGVKEVEKLDYRLHNQDQNSQ
jgi:hypothetical protein